MVSKQEKTKKQWGSLEIEVPLTEGVTATFDDNSILTIKGKKGEVSKLFKYPRVYLKIENSLVKVGTEKFSQRQKKIIHTYRAHINNMMKGVTEGFTYKLVVLFAKFPVSVELKGNKFAVKNLLGEKVPRIVTIPSDVKVEIKAKEITVTGIDKEKTGQVAASLEQLTKVTNMDRRVVQDGIFITEKPHVKYS